MKAVFTILVLAIYFVGCQPKKDTPTAKTKSAKVDLEQLVTSNERLESILLMPEGDFRGLDIGDPIEQVSDLRSALVMEDREYKHYQIDISEYEFFDLIYYNFEGKLDEIEAEVYMEKDDDSYPIYEDLQTFFAQKYGKPMISLDGGFLWNEVKADSSIVAYQLKYVSTFPDTGKESIEKKIKISIKLVN